MASWETGAATRARRILVINGKGGCGKTTVATNLAVAYAAKGRRVALIDNDPQGSSAYWVAQRPQELPELSLLRTRESREYGGEPWPLRELTAPGTECVVVDGHRDGDERDLQRLVRQADVILVPILPSPIDIRVSSHFITQLLTHRRFRATPRPLAVLANRVQPNGDTHAKLKHFLGCLDHPVVATFRDSPVYAEAIETGQGIVDMLHSRAARKETPAWRELTAWIDAQPLSPRDSATRKAPAAAGRQARPARSLSA